MLGKLMKHEWKGMLAPLVIMACLLLGITVFTYTVIMNINTELDEIIENFSATVSTMTFLLYYAGIVGCVIGITLVIAVRFYRTCYTDQGYLTHTLPVSAKQLLIAKTVTAVLSYLIIIFLVYVSVYVALSAFFMRTFDEDWNFLIDAFVSLLRDSLGLHAYPLYIIYWGCCCIISLICSVIGLMGAISLGQLYAKHRIAGAVIAYLVIRFVKRFFTQIIILGGYQIFYLSSGMRNFTGRHGSETWNDVMSSANFSVQVTLFIAMLISIAIAVGLIFASHHMMTKRLNLE